MRLWHLLLLRPILGWDQSKSRMAYLMVNCLVVAWFDFGAARVCESEDLKRPSLVHPLGTRKKVRKIVVLRPVCAQGTGLPHTARFQIQMPSSFACGSDRASVLDSYQEHSRQAAVSFRPSLPSRHILERTGANPLPLPLLCSQRVKVCQASGDTRVDVMFPSL